eukprot:541684-Prorocentrum_minimum.AAC.5
MPTVGRIERSGIESACTIACASARLQQSTIVLAPHKFEATVLERSSATSPAPRPPPGSSVMTGSRGFTVGSVASPSRDLGSEIRPPEIEERKGRTKSNKRFLWSRRRWPSAQACMQEALKEGLHKKFKLTTTMGLSNMHLFNTGGVVTKYDSVEQILDEFYEVRLDAYDRRRAALIKQAEAEMLRLDNRVRARRHTLPRACFVSFRRVDHPYHSQPLLLGHLTKGLFRIVRIIRYCNRYNVSVIYIIGCEQKEVR